MKTRTSPNRVALVPLLVAAVAIGGLAVFSSVPSASAQSTVKVNIQNYAFTPASVKLVIGVNNTVTWANLDSVLHTVTADGGAFDSHNIQGGQTFTFTFTSPGAYTYHCNIHTYMKGTVIVEAKSGTSTSSTSTSSSSAGGVPEFPSGIVAATVTTAVVLVSYLAVTRVRRGRGILSSLHNPRSALTLLLVGTTLLGAVLVGLTAPAARAASVSVNIQGFAFNPNSITVSVGDTVVWTNMDSTTHTVTANDNSFSMTLQPGQTFSHTFTASGTVGYHCAIHPFMTGTVVVAGGTSTTSTTSTTSSTTSTTTASITTTTSATTTTTATTTTAATTTTTPASSSTTTTTTTTPTTTSTTTTTTVPASSTTSSTTSGTGATSTSSSSTASTTSRASSTSSLSSVTESPTSTGTSSSSPSATTSESSTTSSSASSGGAIPEFSFEGALLTLITLALVSSYFVVKISARSSAST